MKFDFTITLGQILTIVVPVSVYLIGYVRWNARNEVRIETLEKSLSAHVACHQKLVEIQTELRLAIAFLRGKNNARLQPKRG